MRLSDKLDAAVAKAQAVRAEHGMDSVEYHAACEAVEDIRGRMFWRGDGTWSDDEAT